MNLQNVRNTFETARTIPGGGPFFILRSSRVPAKRVFHRLIPLSGPIQSDETGRNRAAFHPFNWAELARTGDSLPQSFSTRTCEAPGGETVIFCLENVR